MNHSSSPRFKQGFVIKQNRGIAWSCLYKPPLSRETVSGTDKYSKYSKYSITLQNYYSTDYWPSEYSEKQFLESMLTPPSTVRNRSSKGDYIIDHFFATFLQGLVIQQNAGIAWSTCLCKPGFPSGTVSGHQ